MLLAPYLVEGSIGSFVAKIKSGKTATILEMVRCLRHKVGFCGFPPPASRVRVMYCTEQPRASFVNQLQDAGLQGDEDVVVTYLSGWRGRPWSQVAPALVEAALEHGTQLLVLDTGSQWFGFREDQENQSGAAASVQLLQPLVAQGATILISRHGRKSGGSAHDAGRGAPRSMAPWTSSST